MAEENTPATRESEKECGTNEQVKGSVPLEMLSEVLDAKREELKLQMEELALRSKELDRLQKHEEGVKDWNMLSTQLQAEDRKQTRGTFEKISSRFFLLVGFFGLLFFGLIMFALWHDDQVVVNNLVDKIAMFGGGAVGGGGLGFWAGKRGASQK